VYFGLLEARFIIQASNNEQFHREAGKVVINQLTSPAYPAARDIAKTVEEYFAAHINLFSKHHPKKPAPRPTAESIETIIDATFWASLRREETYSPKISLAFLAPEHSRQPLMFEHMLPLTPAVLARLAPAVERPGIHLGVWSDEGELRIWGTTRTIPPLCFVLEVIEPGLLVVKYRRGKEQGKYINVVVLKGDEIKIVDERGTGLQDCPELLTRMLAFGANGSSEDDVNVLVQLAVSMRAHGRGGSLIVVPMGSESWHDSILNPVRYLVSPPYPELADLMSKSPEERSEQTWQEALIDAVDVIAGLTAVDGAAIISDKYHLLAFGAKLGRRDGGMRVEQVVITEPVVGNIAATIHPLELGGTRHLSAAQFVYDQRDALALVASQDGRFTIFAWSPCEETVHAHRVETLLI
jgi:hypothetical protein